MKRALVIAPHQDDESIGCGGTISLLKEKKWGISVVHVFRGNSGTDLPDGSQIRQEEARKAGAILGYSLLPNLDYVDRSEYAPIELTKSLVRLIQEVNPMIIFLPHRQDRDQEHELVSRAGREAAWLANTAVYGGTAHKADLILYYEVWRQIERPTVFFDITDHIDKKKAAIQCYTSQIHATSWLEGAVGNSAQRGCTLSEKGFAEAFELHPASLETLYRTLELIYGNK